MNLRKRMYSAVIHGAITAGKSIDKIAADLGLTPGQVHELSAAYMPEYNYSKHMTYEQLRHQKVMVRRLKNRIASYVKQQKMLHNEFADSAFHMPISGKHAQAFNRIAYLVARDEYLSPSYRRKPKIIR